MTFRDRTKEFVEIIHRSKQNSVSNGSGPPLANGHHTALTRHSQFTQGAKQIGHYLANTCSKLEKLTLIAKNQSLFNDRSQEIQELTYIIKQDLAQLNKQIGQLQEFSRSQGRESEQRGNHSSRVVMGLQTKLARVSNDFKGVLESRTESLKKQAERRDLFSSPSNIPSSLDNAKNNGVVPSLLLQDEERARSGQEVVSSSTTNDTSRASLSPRYQQQQLLIDETDQYLESRADTMKNIEHTIVELGDIFQQLSFMVKEQEEAVDRIDTNIDDAHMNVEAAHSELLKYLKSVSSNRWLMMKVFGVLIVFFIIFVVLVA